MARNRKPKLHTQEVHNISKHSFVEHEWNGIKSEMEIRKLLQQYRQEFAVRVWSENDIRHFLSVFHYLYPEAQPRYHHIRYLATLIRGMYT